jgi:hypothetical protein
MDASIGMRSALEVAELKAMQLTSQTIPETSTPLETLIVQQLAEIVREERLLAERYHQLAAADKSATEMNLFSDQLSRFDQRANRLFRLMEAMEVC